MVRKEIVQTYVLQLGKCPCCTIPCPSPTFSLPSSSSDPASRPQNERPARRRLSERRRYRGSSAAAVYIIPQSSMHVEFSGTSPVAHSSNATPLSATVQSAARLSARHNAPQACVYESAMRAQRAGHCHGCRCGASVTSGASVLRSLAPPRHCRQRDG